jgi:small-conductance mechanosensitive channel
MNEGVAAWAMSVLVDAKARVEALTGHLAQAPDEFHQLAAAASGSLMSGAGVRGFTYLLILLLVGFGAEWLYWTYAYGSWRAIQSMPATSPAEALKLGRRRLLLQGAGLLLFTVAAVGASAAFAWPAGVQEVVIASTLLLLVLRLAWIVVATLLAPGRPHLRLVPVEPRRARWLAVAVMAAVCLLALGRFVPDLLERVAGARHAPDALRLAMYTLAALLALLISAGFVGRRPARTAGSRRSLPRFPQAFVVALLIVSVYAVWLISPAVALMAAIVAVVIALQLALHDMVFFFWNDTADPGALPSIVLSAARFVVVLLGLSAFMLALDTPIAKLAESESLALRLGLRALGVATLALLINVLWIGVRTTIDQRLERIRPSPDAVHGEPDANARLLTLLPLLRVTAAVLLFVMLVLSSLWALGIEITPLLAGAGVVGLALGFGAQALVRDVIAGIFFLAEDAFRVGEYIESGTNTKGTVERISLRTVALRHHNGPLHFVPYGALGTVRNTSRDWVIEKFNLPLPIGVDSEKIRKMVKKIGEEMKADPEVGPLLLEPLKGKLYRIDPGVKIFRCKFMTAPGKQFDVRAQALKRIEASLKAMGIGFADGAQTVLLPAPTAP